MYIDLPENSISEAILGAAIEVHRTLGPGLLESTYEACLMHEMSLRGITFQHQMVVPVIYKNLRVDNGLRLDLLVEEKVIVELKAIEHILPIHESQTATYLKLMRYRLGLVINFNVRRLNEGGIRRVVVT